MLFASREYIGKRVKFEDLTELIVNFFKEEGFKTQSIHHPAGYIVQARKGGIFRALLGSNHAFTMAIDGHPAHFRIKIGVSPWIDKEPDEVEEFFRVPYRKFLETPEALWAYELEHHLWHYIENQIELSK
ncbi:MAG TPA: hypothetical protein VKU79_04925 [Thermoplasmataceae archaeon]|nr:hypothetical protein [Thermoplasmatales archaeon AK]HLH86188.1 hypothetical protein [Thermoplasmataceae archaeon]